MVRIFPNNSVVVRFVGVILADMQDEGQADDGRYLSQGWMDLSYPKGALAASPQSTTAGRHTQDQPTSRRATQWDGTLP